MITVHEDGRVTGAVFRTPPFPLGVTGLPSHAVQAVAAKVRELDPDLPAVNGKREIAEAFAVEWQHITGREWRVDRNERLYRLGALVPPVVRGAARPATEDDMELLALWRKEFTNEAMGKNVELDSARTALRHVLETETTILVWEVDGQPVACASSNRPLAGMCRVSFVYTPPEQRGNGYASAVTAAMSRWAIDAGADRVVLFTDIDNPVSNAIYQRIGYLPVHDTVNVLLG
ncbi:GNAT family N-acetyltransferase [Allokutzneria oryzae]|uniref:GNAT family N-acetyltransferase n=1 Tax=Allokutzneria oryzae TaxID=1378989 RepID=A0ABV5ZNB5_9PSEU